MRTGVPIKIGMQAQRAIAALDKQWADYLKIHCMTDDLVADHMNADEAVRSLLCRLGCFKTVRAMIAIEQRYDRLPETR